MVTVHVQRTPRGGWPRPAALERLAAGGLGSGPPPVLALAGIVSVQLGAALAKQLFAATGPLGAVALRVGFAAVILLVAWRPHFPGRPACRAGDHRLWRGAGHDEHAVLRGHRPDFARCRGYHRVPGAAGDRAGGLAPLAGRAVGVSANGAFTTSIRSRKCYRLTVLRT